MLVFSSTALSQDVYESFEEVCLMDEETIVEGELPSTTQILRGGREITANGELKVLVIFVRFKDDTENTTYWPDYTVLPDWAQNIIDPQVPQNNIYTPLNLSDYFDRASGGDGSGNLGTFKVIGDVHYVVLDHDRSYYGTNNTLVNQHALTKLDTAVNYADYDNWKFRVNGEYYNHAFLPDEGDGIVDYIFIFWRDLRLTQPNIIGHKTLYVNNLVLDGKTINSSSGSTQFQFKYEGPYNSTFQNRGSILIPAHEMTHYIFGGVLNQAHLNTHGTNIGNVEFFTLMTSNANFASFFSAYERYRAGWLNPTVIEGNMSSVVIRDTHTKHDAVMIPLRYDNSTPQNIIEYFLIENFHTENDYSGANPFLIRSLHGQSLTHGIVVFHIENEDLSVATNSDLDIETADGLFDWLVVEGENTPSDRTDDLTGYLFPSYYSGFDERDQIAITVGGINYTDYFALLSSGHTCLTGNPCPPPCNLIQCNHGWRYDKNKYFGGNEDLFRLGDFDNEVFTRWSNPGSHKNDQSASDKGFEVINYNSSTKEYTLSVQTNSSGCESLSPSRPYLLSLTPYSANGNAGILITWVENQEPDLSGYEVYRQIGSGSIDKISGSNLVTDTTWVHWGVIIASPGSDYTYYVKAVDTQNNRSNYSNGLNTTVQYVPGGGQDKHTAQLEGTPENLARSFALYANFPNPFNPVTTIAFTLAEQIKVRLTVHSITGEHVATLINREMTEGYHQVSFDASKLTSGIYLYRIQAGNFTQTRKMMLLR